MVRHVHHTHTHQAATVAAKRSAAKTSAETNPFRSVLDSTTGSTKTASAAPATQITATVTKEAAKPAVALSTPVYEEGATLSNPDGSETLLNWTEFADAATAQQIAAKLGGTVKEADMSGYSVPERSIAVPGSPNRINAGIAARLFAQYGDQPGSLAWQVINRDLGRDPMAT